MPKEEWGVKRICPSCASRFYDLQMDPMTCPECGATFTVESLNASKPKALRTEKAKAPDESTEDLPDIDDSDDDIDNDDIDDDILEDDDENVSLDEIADVGTDDEED